MKSIDRRQSRIVSTPSGTHGRAHFSRRSLLKALGAGAGMIPLLETDLVAACATTGPKRLMIVLWGNGVLEWPKGSERDFVLPKFMEPLAPLRNDITFIDRDRLDLRIIKAHPDKGGADLEGHGSAGILLSGWPYKKTGSYVYDAGGPTLDHFVGQELRAGGFKGRPNMVLGALHKWSYSTWTGAAQPNPPDNDPYHVFDTVFAGRVATGPDPAGERARRFDKSILAYVGRESRATEPPPGQGGSAPGGRSYPGDPGARTATRPDGPQRRLHATRGDEAGFRRQV